MSNLPIPNWKERVEREIAAGMLRGDITEKEEGGRKLKQRIIDICDEIITADGHNSEKLARELRDLCSQHRRPKTLRHIDADELLKRLGRNKYASYLEITEHVDWPLIQNVVQDLLEEMKTQADTMPVPEGHCFVTITAKKGEGLSIAGQVTGRVETTWPLHEGPSGAIDRKGSKPLLVKAYLEVVMFESSGEAAPETGG